MSSSAGDLVRIEVVVKVGKSADLSGRWRPRASHAMHCAMDFGDPARVDSQIEEAVQRVVRWRQVLREDPSRAREQDPFVGMRGISTRAAFQAVQRMPATLPGRDEMTRWIAMLTIERVTMEDLLDFEAARRTPEHVVQRLGKQPWSLRDLGLDAAFHPDAERRALAADAVVWLADDASSNALWWLARRHEAANQLGIGSVSSIEEPFADGAEVDGIAQIVLSETDDLACDVLGKRAAWQDALASGAAGDALEGWPARLTTRWLQELFGEPLLRGLRVSLGTLPTARNGSSFVRALARFGASLHRAAARVVSPMFCIAQQPFDPAAASYGALFASVLASEAFLRRHLGLGATSCLPQRRSIARCLLVGLRLAAAKAVVASCRNEAAAREAHATWVSRALCSSMPADLAGLLPRYDPRAAALLGGAIEAALERETLVSRFDEDWFDNPRGQAKLREVDLSMRPRITLDRAREGAKAALRYLGEPFR